MKNIAFAAITEYRQKVLQDSGVHWFHQENEGLFGRTTDGSPSSSNATYMESQRIESMAVA